MHPIVLRALTLIGSYKGEVDRREFFVGYWLATGVMLVIGYGVLGLWRVATTLLPGSWPSPVVAVTGLASMVVVIAACAGPLGALLVKRHRSVGLAGWTGPATATALLVGFFVCMKLGMEQGDPVPRGLSIGLLGWQLFLLLWPPHRSVGEKAAEAFA